MLSKRAIGIGWRLLEFCYLNNQLKEQVIQSYVKMILAKFETLNDINGEATYSSQGNPGKTFLQALEKDFQLISWIGYIWNKGWRWRSGRPPDGTMQGGAIQEGEGAAKRRVRRLGWRRCCLAVRAASKKVKVLLQASRSQSRNAMMEEARAPSSEATVLPGDVRNGGDTRGRGEGVGCDLFFFFWLAEARRGVPVF